MGLAGSDTAKQSADIVLADDNFATIVRAVRKGRSVFKNVRVGLLNIAESRSWPSSCFTSSRATSPKWSFCSSCAAPHACTADAAQGLVFQELPGQNGLVLSVFPLSPVAALWINTLAAGPPALALCLEPTAVDAMDHGPEQYKRIFTLRFCTPAACAPAR